MKRIELLLIFFFLYAYILCSENEVEPGNLIIANTCGNLGGNNPLRKLDCTIYNDNIFIKKKQKWKCCYLTVTKESNEYDDDTQTYQVTETYYTACIKMSSTSANAIKEEEKKLMEYGDDVLIECKANFFNYMHIFISILLYFIVI